jgi:hypothetical protein
LAGVALEGGVEDKGPSRRPRSGQKINISCILQAGVAGSGTPYLGRRGYEARASGRGAEPGLVHAVHRVQTWSPRVLESSGSHEVGRPKVGA